MKNKLKSNYNRNDFFSYLEQAKELGFIEKDKTLITFGERAPDKKIIDASSIFQITVVEGFNSNVFNMKINFPNWKYHLNLIELFVLTNEFQKNEWDICWWFHGPEHLSKEDSFKILDEMKKRCKMIITSMPHGTYKQDTIYGNILEEHKSSLYPQDFLEHYKKNCWVFYETENGNDKTSIDVFIKGDLE